MGHGLSGFVRGKKNLNPIINPIINPISPFSADF